MLMHFTRSHSRSQFHRVINHQRSCKGQSSWGRKEGKEEMVTSDTKPLRLKMGKGPLVQISPGRAGEEGRKN